MIEGVRVISVSPSAAIVERTATPPMRTIVVESNGGCGHESHVPPTTTIVAFPLVVNAEVVAHLVISKSVFASAKPNAIASASAPTAALAFTSAYASAVQMLLSEGWATPRTFIATLTTATGRPGALTEQLIVAVRKVSCVRSRTGRAMRGSGAMPRLT